MGACDFALEYVDTILFDEQVQADEGMIGEEIYACPACGEQTRSPIYFGDNEEL